MTHPGGPDPTGLIEQDQLDWWLATRLPVADISLFGLTPQAEERQGKTKER